MSLRAAVVGFGKMGRIRAREIRKSPSVRLVGVYELGATLGADFGESVVATKSFDALLDLAPDMLFVCAVNKHAAEYTMAALKRGIHVFCEKPPARNVAELEEVIAVEATSGRVLKYGFNHRLHYSVMEARKLMESGAYGRLLWLRGVYGKAGSIDYGSNWRNFRALSGGGILLDQGIHMLDLFYHLSGLDLSISSALLTTSYWNVEVEDNAFVTLKAGPVVATLHSSANQWRHKFLLEMCFENGYINLDGILSESRSYTPEMLVSGRREFEDITFAMGKPAEQTVVFENDDSWRLELEEFVAAILHGTPFNGTSQEALRVLRLVEDIYRESGHA